MPTCFIADMNECETAGFICLTILLHMSVRVLCNKCMPILLQI